MEPRKVKRVVVIGAGMAGLAAASILHSKFNVSLSLLEATDRLGGRCSSEGISDFNVELGAGFFHGAKGNVIYEMACRLGLASEPAREIPEENIKYYLSNGRVLDPTVSVLGECSDAFDEVLSQLKTPEWTCRNGDLREYIKVGFYRWAESGKGFTFEEKSLVDSIFHMLLCNEGASEGASLCRGVGISSCRDYDVPEGPLEHCFMPPHCYKDIIDKISTNIPKNCIHFNTVVSQIKWTPSSLEDGNETSCPTGPPVEVVTSKGSYYADHVILTVPLGVLKKCGSDLFSPPLPKDKQLAIQRIGNGLLDKVILEFDEPLIQDDTELTFLLWTREDLESYSLIREYPWLSSFYVLMKIPGSNIYYIWFAGKDAEMISQLPSELVSQLLLKVLEDKFFKFSIPQPRKVIKTNWSQKPFCGSYSFSSPVSSGKEREVLGQPLDGSTPLQVLFAGEATNLIHFATVNGAYESGLRESTRIIESGLIT